MVSNLLFGFGNWGGKSADSTPIRPGRVLGVEGNEIRVSHSTPEENWEEEYEFDCETGLLDGWLSFQVYYAPIPLKRVRVHRNLRRSVFLTRMLLITGRVRVRRVRHWTIQPLVSTRLSTRKASPLLTNR